MNQQLSCRKRLDITLKYLAFGVQNFNFKVAHLLSYHTRCAVYANFLTKLIAAAVMMFALLAKCDAYNVSIYTLHLSRSFAISLIENNLCKNTLAYRVDERRKAIVCVRVFSSHVLHYQSFCDHSRNFAQVNFEGLVGNV